MRHSPCAPLAAPRGLLGRRPAARPHGLLGRVRRRLRRRPPPPWTAAPAGRVGAGERGRRRRPRRRPTRPRAAKAARPATRSTSTTQQARDQDRRGVACAATTSARRGTTCQVLVDEHGGQSPTSRPRPTTTGEPLRARMVLRVPVARLRRGDGRARRASATWVDEPTSSEDVTTQVIDNDARVKVQQAQRPAGRGSCSPERRRSATSWRSSPSSPSRQAELDSLKQQQAYLEDQTSLATDQRLPRAQARRRGADRRRTTTTGFLAGLAAGWDGLETTVVAVRHRRRRRAPVRRVVLAGRRPVWLLVRRMRRTAAPFRVVCLTQRRGAASGARPVRRPGSTARTG